MTAAGTKYQYERRLGGGGMAEVFLARTVGVEGFTRPIAIKRVLPHYSHDQSFSVMFINEARISAMLRHPNIVQVLDFDRDAEGRLYLVMELVEGKDLSDLLERGALPLPVVVHVTVEILRGLAHAHEMTNAAGKPLGIVHRDISPHNVLISWDGAVKVSDFGIAKAMNASGIAHSGMIKGKPLYMAPEQVLAPDTLDHRADLFAVGVMLHEMLTGTRVYQGATHEEVLTDVLQVAHGLRRLTAPMVVRPDLPADISQVAMRLLAPSREHRYAHARDAIDDLVACQAATPHGGERLAEMLAERFAGEAPPRVVRRQRGPIGLSTGPQDGTWVVTPRPPAELAGGTPRPTDETRTQTPRPLDPTTSLRGRGSRRGLLLASLGLAAAAVAAAIAILVVPGRDGPTSAPQPAESGAVVPPDAAPMTAPPDAARPPVDAAPVDAEPAAADAAPPPPDAKPKGTDKKDKKTGKTGKTGKRDGTGTGGTTIHDIDIEGGK